MKNLSNFNLLIIILLFSSCRQQPFTGTVHIIPYPNQIAIGTQYRPIGKIDFDIYRSRHFEPTNFSRTRDNGSQYRRIPSWHIFHLHRRIRSDI